MLDHILRHSRIYFLILIIASLFGIAVTGISAYHGARASEERDLIARAQTIAYLFEPRELAFLSGDASDLNNPFYVSIKERLRDVKEVNSDVRFIYFTGRNEDDTIFFYLDSESASSPDNSPPGQEYTEASVIFHEVFTLGRARFEGPIADRWGKWISAFVPIRHPGTGKIIAVLGIDISATQYYQRISSAIATPIFFIIFFMMIVVIVFREYKKREEILSMKAGFVSIASHELRSPLVGLVWATQALLRDEAAMKMPGLKETLSLMERTFNNMLETVNGILDFSRLEHLREGGLSVSPLNLSELVRECADALALFAREKKTPLVIEEGFPQELQVVGDREKIKRAINNIISNAIKYSSADNVIRIIYQRDGDEHVIRVNNRGRVIEAGDQKKIFSKFFRAGKTDTVIPGVPSGQEGTGLGLYFAKQIISAHGGRIWFDSSPEHGTNFYIALKIKI